MSNWAKTFAEHPVIPAGDEIRRMVAELRRWAVSQDEELANCLREAEAHRVRASEYRTKADALDRLLEQVE